MLFEFAYPVADTDCACVATEAASRSTANFSASADFTACHTVNGFPTAIEIATTALPTAATTPVTAARKAYARSSDSRCASTSSQVVPLLQTDAAKPE